MRGTRSVSTEVVLLFVNEIASRHDAVPLSGFIKINTKPEVPIVIRILIASSCFY